MLSLTLLSLNSLKYSLGVTGTTACTGEPVVLIITQSHKLQSLIDLSFFGPILFNHIKCSIYIERIRHNTCHRVLLVFLLVDTGQGPPGLLSRLGSYFVAILSVLRRRNNQSRSAKSRFPHEMIQDGSLETNKTYTKYLK